MKIQELLKIDPIAYQSLRDIALQRIQLKFDNISRNKRLDFLFENPTLIHGFFYSSQFLVLIRKKFPDETINKILESNEPNEELDNFVYEYTKHKTNSFAHFINIITEQYLQNEMQAIFDFQEKHHRKIPNYLIIQRILNPNLKLK